MVINLGQDQVLLSSEPGSPLRWVAEIFWALNNITSPFSNRAKALPGQNSPQRKTTHWILSESGLRSPSSTKTSHQISSGLIMLWKCDIHYYSIHIHNRKNLTQFYIDTHVQINVPYRVLMKSSNSRLQWKFHTRGHLRQPPPMSNFLCFVLHTFIQSWEQGRGNIPACATSIWFNSTSQVVHAGRYKQKWEQLYSVGVFILNHLVSKPVLRVSLLRCAYHGTGSRQVLAMIRWNDCKINVRGAEWERDRWSLSSGLDGQLPRSPVPQLSVSPWLCTCVLLTAHAWIRVPCRVSWPVRAQTGAATLHHTTGHTRGQADNFTLRHPKQKTAK